jgi:hypothetical protein
MNVRIYPVALALIASTAGMAQSVDFGLQLGPAFPGGGMTKVLGSDASIALGGQLRVGLRGGHAVVPRLDYVSFEGTDDDWLPPAKVKESLLSLGVDYNYYVSRRVGKGFYFGGGLGFMQLKETYSAPEGFVFAAGTDPSETKNRLYFSTGLGVAINKHVSLFGRGQFFFDDQKDEYWDYETGERRTTYELSTVVTVGVEVHF